MRIKVEGAAHRTQQSSEIVLALVGNLALGVKPKVEVPGGGSSGANRTVDFSSLEVGSLKAERILLGSNDKVAVIGRTMGDGEVKGVRDYANALRERGVDVEIFDGKMISPAAQREVEMRTPDGKWIEKTSNQGQNTMFPKDWNEVRVTAEIESAWGNRTAVAGNKDMWEGRSASGVLIRGHLNPRITAYPMHGE